jgi:hypothetical protein
LNALITHETASIYPYTLPVVQNAVFINKDNEAKTINPPIPRRNNESRKLLISSLRRYFRMIANALNPIDLAVSGWFVL